MLAASSRGLADRLLDGALGLLPPRRRALHRAVEVGEEPLDRLMVLLQELRGFHAVPPSSFCFTVHCRRPARDAGAAARRPSACRSAAARAPPSRRAQIAP